MNKFSSTRLLAASVRRGALALALSLPLSNVLAQAPDAQDATPIVMLSASASADVVPDTLSITLRVLRQGSDSAGVQSQLKQVLDTALGDARRAAASPAVDVHTGGFNISPRYGNNGSITGWQGQADLVVEGRDSARVAALAGRLAGLSVVSSNFSVSGELRERHSSELASEAIRRFRRRAADVAQGFGYTDAVPREVNVSHADGDAPRPMPMLAMARGAVMADSAAPVPVEAGVVRLTASVQGSVRLVGKR
ncbi:MAG: hypothetical protein RL375_2024 [Pseudomonadota bacterium]